MYIIMSDVLTNFENLNNSQESLNILRDVNSHIKLKKFLNILFSDSTIVETQVFTFKPIYGYKIDTPLLSGKMSKRSMWGSIITFLKVLNSSSNTITRIWVPESQLAKPLKLIMEI